MIRSMRARWLMVWLGVGLSSGFGCGGGDERPAYGVGGTAGASGSAGSDGGGASGQGGSAGTGGSSGASGSSGSGGNSGSAGTSGSSGSAGSAGSASDAAPDVVSVCGDGVAEADEACDGADLRDQNCVSFGFDQGTLACADCNIDTRGCSGDERCSDGRDNDGDFRVDCNDSDCTTDCASSCSAPTLLSDPAQGISGVTNGHASELTPSCLQSGLTSGRELVYRITAAHTGVLETIVTSSGPDFNVSVRGTCGSAPSELGCVDRSAGAGGTERLRVAVTQGEQVFIIVDGSGSSEAGAFVLSAASRAVVCGDGNRDLDEECDDGAKVSGDGCSSTCHLEANETEPNGTVIQADAYDATPFFASISPAGDVDVFAVTVTKPNTKLTAETFDLGDGACAKLLMDTFVEILDTNGSTVLASNDDVLTNFCSSASKDGLPVGKYYVRVRGVEGSTFPYALSVGLSP